MAEEAASIEDSQAGTDTILDQAIDAALFEDLLVTNEGEWIESHTQKLKQIWRVLQQACKRSGNSYLGDCSFNVFASFMYRWTDQEDGDTGSVISIGSVSSHASVQAGRADAESGGGERAMAQ